MSVLTTFLLVLLFILMVTMYAGMFAAMLITAIKERSLVLMFLCFSMLVALAFAISYVADTL